MAYETMIQTLEHAPEILKEMMAEVPAELMRAHRIPGKWCVHEHACHLAAGQPMLNERLRRFMQEEHPQFVPYNPENETPNDFLLKMDLNTALDDFEKLRKAFIRQLRDLKESDWRKEGHHPEFSRYTPFILMRHVMFHDHLHMYRIESLILMR